MVVSKRLACMAFAVVAALALSMPAAAWAEEDELIAGMVAQTEEEANAAGDAAPTLPTPASAIFEKSTAKLDVDKSKGWLIADGSYYFVSAKDSSNVIGSKGIVQQKTGAKSQIWKIEFDCRSQCYTIKNAKTGKALTATNKGKKGAKLTEAPLKKAKQHVTKLTAIPAFNIPIPTQRWMLRSTPSGYYFVSAVNKTLAIDLSKAQTRLVKSSTKKPSQFIWIIGEEGTFSTNGLGEGVFTIKSQSGKDFLNIEDSSIKPGDAACVGDALTLWGEMFRFEHVGKGWYKILNYNSGLALTATTAHNIEQKPFSGDLKSKQIWKPVIVGSSGGVQLISKFSGKVLAYKDDELRLMKRNALDLNQRWRINPTTTGLTTVGEKALTRANKRDSKTKYCIVVDMGWHEYFLFRKAVKKQKGAPWVLDDTSRCSTGKNKITKSSVNTLGWRAAPPNGLVSGVGAKYCYWAGHGSYLHSIVTYGPQGENQMGWYISNGCIRLPYKNAKYVFNLKLTGTRMIRYYT